MALLINPGVYIEEVEKAQSQSKQLGRPWRLCRHNQTGKPESMI
jgi:hypothetical protein